MRIIQLHRFLMAMMLISAVTRTMNGQDSFSCYKATQVADRVWTIVENNTVNIYVVAGNDSALIIDAGYGTGDLKGYVQTLTDLPLILVNTHGHGDHAGSDHQFSKVYAHRDDFELVKNNLERHGKNDNLVIPTISVQEGYQFDLGGRKLEVIEVPGHTHGSICLLDPENKILFAGDHINAIVWLFLKDSYPLETYLKSLEKVEKRMIEYDIIMPGHNAPLENKFIYELITCVKSIFDGTCTAVPYNYSERTAEVMLCKYKTSEVAYDPENLFIEKAK